MNRFLALVVIVATFTFATSVKEWKNFENGKVYSHKTMSDKKEVKTHAPNRAIVEERLLHSHHRDKKIHHQLKTNRLQIADSKEFRSKNPERHHKKSIEEEMHLKPLNERHHKFPNPALLTNNDDSNHPSPQITKQKLIKQAKAGGRLSNRRRLRDRRYKRNKFDQKQQMLLDDNSQKKSEHQEIKSKSQNISEKSEIISPTQKTAAVNINKHETSEKFSSKLPSYW